MSLDSKIKDAFARHETDVRPRPGAWTDVERSIGRSHRRRILGAGLGTALAIAGAVLAIPRIDVQDIKPPPVSTEPPTGEPRVVAKIAARVSRLAAGGESLWGLAAPEREGGGVKLLRIDPKADRVVASIEIGPQSHALAADRDSVWVTNPLACGESCGDASPPPTPAFPDENSVVRVDPRTNKVVVRIRVVDPQDVAIGANAVWVTSAGPDGLSLVRIDPTLNVVAYRLPLPGARGFGSVTVGEGFVWVAAQPDAGDETMVFRVDSSTGRIRMLTVAGGSPLSHVAAGEGDAWVTTVGGDTASAIARISAADFRVVTTIALPDAAPVGLTAITTGDGYVLAASARGNLWKVDPRSDRPTGEPVLIGEYPPVGAGDVVVAFDSVWVASDDGNIYRLAP